MRNAIFGLTAGVLASLMAVPLSAAPPSTRAAKEEIERGRYMVSIGGCNDCHTAGFAPGGGKTPEAQWLTGNPLGFRGPWGTTYAVNLRLYFQRHTADEWVKAARTLETRPPMPWFVLREFTESDLRAMHAFIRTLGPMGEPAPAYLPPGEEPKGPVVVYPAPPR